MGVMSSAIPNFSMTMEESNLEDENDDAVARHAGDVDGDGNNNGSTNP